RFASRDLDVVRARTTDCPGDFLDATGVVPVKNFAFAASSHIRNVAVCGLLTLALTACGMDGTSTSGSGSVSSDAPSLVNPSVGVIERGSSANESPITAALDNPAPSQPASDGTTTTGTGSGGTTGTGSGGTTGTGTGGTVASNPPSTGSATLDWTPPTENADGSALTNLAGYTVYYGTSPTNLTQSVKIANPGLSAYTMTNLAAGTWYFAVSSYSSSGAESVRSGIVSTRI